MSENGMGGVVPAMAARVTLSAKIDPESKSRRAASQGRACHDRSTKARRRTYDRNSHRLREIGRLIASRHGTSLDTDDASIYLAPVARTLLTIVLQKGHAQLDFPALVDRLLVLD
jgi:hypothetical protein